MGNGECRVVIGKLAANGKGFIVLMGPNVDASGHARDDGRKRIEFVRTIDFGNGILFAAANHPNIVGIPLPRRGIVGIKFKRPFELSFSAGKVPLVLHFVASQNGVGMRQRRVQLESLAGRAVRLGELLAGIAAKIWQHGINIGQPRIGQGVARIFLDGLIKIGDSLLEFGIGAVVPGVAPFQIQVIGF